MFYAHQGVVYVTEIGRLQSEWLQVESSGMDIGMCIKYMWWVYSKTSDFRSIPMAERLVEIQKRLGLSDKEWKALVKGCAACVAYYLNVQLSSLERNRIVIVEKQHHLREAFMKENDPNELLVIEKALKVLEQREREYDMEIERSGGDGVWAVSCPRNLFSLPEEHKPLAIRVVL